MRVSGKGTRRKKAVLAALILVPVLAAALDVRLRTVHDTVVSSALTAHVRLALLTDLHSCAYGERQETLLRAVEEQAPDAVILAGDIVDDVLPEENAWTAVSALAEAYPCLYVTGNHEYWSGEADRICGDMEALGVLVLRGSAVSLELGGQSLQFCGVDDPDSGQTAQQLAQVGERLGEGFSILLAHRPEAVYDYVQYPFDLILSGHAHGGQWRIPGLLNGLYAPNQGLFPKYAGGRYDVENTVLIVSRGLARESTSIPRIFNRPELVIVDLLPARGTGMDGAEGS